MASWRKPDARTAPARRLRQEAEGGVQRRTACARNRFDGSRASPDSGDSQFFICFDDARFLDNQYTVWGKVTSGMENVDKIKRGEPVKNPDKIVSAKMVA
jgi:cyclophilin family peptidyl-prolyl cis-trans isomerase